MCWKNSTACQDLSWNTGESVSTGTLVTGLISFGATNVSKGTCFLTAATDFFVEATGIFILVFLQQVQPGIFKGSGRPKESAGIAKKHKMYAIEIRVFICV